MHNKKFHSGHKLQALRVLKGLKEKELAEVLGYEFKNILDWEEKGVPDKELHTFSDFFDVNEDLFFIDVLNDVMLNKLTISAMDRPVLEIELKERLKLYLTDESELHLSSLGLLNIPDLVFDLPNLKAIDLSDNLLSEIPEKLQHLINEGCEVNLQNNFIAAELPHMYNQPNKKIVELPVKEDIFIEKVKFIQLRLENIGIFEDVTIQLNDQLTVFIGVNGAGKTTILKALSLAVLGPRDSINSKAFLLRSFGVPNTVNSQVTLIATVDGVEYTNTVTLSYESDVGEVKVIGSSFKALYKNLSTLKNLILCLGEQRNHSSANEKQNLEKSPRILDLLPLLRGDDQSCMKDFTSWWANLEATKLISPDNQNIINLCFEIFSKFMGEEIESAGLKKVKPNTELWLKYDTGKLLPFHLASQGYQSVMGWIGFIIQRMIEANEDYPLPLNQPSIIIIDEVDQLLSVKWQQNIIGILKSFFPNTQWIISTHSPMVLTKLDKKQVVQLHERDGKIVAETNEVDLWMWQYGDIIRQYFDVSTLIPKYQEQDLKKEIDKLIKTPLENRSVDFNNNLAEKQNILLSVQKSRARIDPIYEQQLSLHEREQELKNLIEEIKSKVKG